MWLRSWFLANIRNVLNAENTFRMLLFSLLYLKLFTNLNSAGNKAARPPEVPTLQKLPSLFLTYSLVPSALPSVSTCTTYCCLNSALFIEESMCKIYFHLTLKITKHGILLPLHWYTSNAEYSEKEMTFNPLTPNDPCRGRTAPLTSKVAFYIFIQQI